jgi:hypothetical protein
MSDQGIGDGLDALSAAEGLEDDAAITGAPPNYSDLFDDYDDVNPAMQRFVEQTLETAATVQNWQLEAQADDLAARYPELNDYDNAKALIQDAAQRAHALGNPALANSPAFWEMVHEARRGASQERARPDDPMTLESIVRGGRGEGLGRRCLPFSG